MARLTKAEKERRAAQKRELKGIALFGIAILLGAILWLPESLTGVLGYSISSFSYALFGTAAHLLPLLMGYLAAELLLSKEAILSAKRQRLVLILILSIVIIIALFTVNEENLIREAITGDKVAATAVLKQLWQPYGIEQIRSFWSGGFFANIIALGLLNLLGKLGSLILLFIFLLIILLLLFNFSYVSLVRGGYSNIKRQREQWQEERQRRLEELSLRRADGHNLLDQEGHKSVDEFASFPISDTSEYITEHHSSSEEYPESEENAKQLDFATRQLDCEISVLPQELAGEHNDVEFNLPSGDWRNNGEVVSKPVHSAVEAEELVEPSNDTEDEAQGLITEEITTEAKACAESKEQSADEEDLDILTRAAEIEALKEPLQINDERENWIDRSDSDKPSKKRSQFEIYAAPPVKLLQPEPKIKQNPEQEEEIRLLGATLEKTLNDFGINAKVVNYTTGPTISRFEIAPGAGVKVSKIVNLADDIALALAAIAVRIEAPIPGKSAVGIEIPNKQITAVLLRGILEDKRFKDSPAPLLSALGRDIQGEPIFCDISKMPHLLIAGATGSGKSVCINSILISLLYRSGPEKLRLLMIDPKVVELSVYNGIPHLLQPVVTNPKKATAALRWAVDEMNRRYRHFAEAKVRDFNSFNSWLEDGNSFKDPQFSNETMPYIVLVIDELSDLMATSATEVEEAISRLTAMARAAGIHLIIATQRPSVDVITGVIKANIPSRIAFAVASQVDSRTILDLAGAEKLLGKGDMIYAPQSAAKSLRGQGAFVTDREVEAVVRYLKENYGEQYDEKVKEAIESTASSAAGSGIGGSDADDLDDLLHDAMQVCLDNDYASISLLQRRLNIGYPRAARIIDQLHDLGAIGPFEGSKPRKIVVKDKEQFLALLSGGGE